MRPGKAAAPPPKAGAPAPVRQRQALAGADRNQKLARQVRKLLGKHYASKYQTRRRG